MIAKHGEVDLLLLHLLEQGFPCAVSPENLLAYLHIAAPGNSLRCPQDPLGLRLHIGHVGVQRGWIGQLDHVSQHEESAGRPHAAGNVCQFDGMVECLQAYEDASGFFHDVVLHIR